MSGREGRPGATLVLGVVLCLTAAAGGLLLGRASTAHDVKQPPTRQNLALRSAVLHLRWIVSDFAAYANVGVPPPAREVVPGGLRHAGAAWKLDNIPWPTNPYRGGPMRLGTGPGDYVYRVTGPSTYTLTAYGRNGRPLVVEHGDVRIDDPEGG